MSVKDVSKKSAELDAKLKGKLFLGGAKPSAEDVQMFSDLLGAGHNNVYRWVKNIASFTEAERNAWGAPVKVTAPTPAAAAPAATAKKPAAAAAAAAAPVTATAKKPAAPVVAAAAKKKDDDEDIDLFGDATEEETAALEAKKKKDAEAKKTKKVIIAKSSILLDIKPWDDKVDLEGLAKKLHAIARDGLLWGDHKLVPVAFGVKKLQQLIVIEDDKVSSDDLEELIMSFEEEVQSMDVVAWNKI